MKKQLIPLVLLCFLLLLLVSPLSAFAPLLLVLIVGVISMMIGTLFRAFTTDTSEPQE